MPHRPAPRTPLALLLALAALYFATSLGHFAHNAEFLCEYPNLPAWLNSAQVYGTWAAITALGLLGLCCLRRRWNTAGLLLVAAYAACGFDGLGHYALAPMAFHTPAANATILSEVAAAALLLAAALAALVRAGRYRRPACN